MDYLVICIIGLAMGTFGGLLGIGGSVIMIPAMLWQFGENQHLYQASAMICNVFVATAATIAHKKTKLISIDILKFLVPTAAVGVIAGVAFSNSQLFAEDNSKYLAKLLGAFLIYVAIDNIIKLQTSKKQSIGLSDISTKKIIALKIVTGMMTGFAAGLLGLGGGVVCVPLQQILLKMPLKKAIANSAATIIPIAIIGAILKNGTLGQHEIEVTESLKIAAIIIPAATVGSFCGGKLVHIFHENIVRIIFICLMILSCFKLLTTT